MSGANFSGLSIGRVALDFPVVQAALSGYSDGPMRRMARRMGAPYTLCEVILDEFVLTSGRRVREQLQLADEEQPVGGQLMGSDPDTFAPAARKLAEAGFAVIDINFGCPVKKVLGRCRGGFHLGQPEVALEIVDRVRDSVPAHVPVTVKMRRGIDDSDGAREDFFRILDGAYARGVAAITVHARTVKQGYVGPSRWAFLREVKAHVGSRVVLGSGDLFSAKACLDMIAETGVDGVTVARGAIGNPWLFAEARELAAGRALPEPPSVREQGRVLAEHFAIADEVYGVDRTVSEMRKCTIRYSELHPDWKTVRHAFATAKRREECREILATHYQDERPGRRPEPS